MKKYRILFFAVVLFFQSNAIAQQGTNETAVFAKPVEAVFLSANTTTLLTGETFYYAFHCWNTQTKSPSEISKIGYVELVDAEGNSVLKQKINLVNGWGNGDFFVPMELNTGNYKLVAYTKWMLNEELSELFQMDVLLINPFRALSKNMVDTSKVDSIPKAVDSIKPTIEQTDEKINFPFLAKTNFSIREKVEFSLQGENQLDPGNYSISIRKRDNLPENTSLHPKLFMENLDNSSERENNTTPTKSSTTLLPELRGEMLVGKIHNKVNPTDISDKTIALSLPGKSFVFKTSQTDQHGNFRFILDPVPGQTNAVIQIMEENRKNYELQLTQKNGDFSGLEFEQLKLAPNQQRMIEERSVAIQIENAYYHKKQDSLLPEKTTDAFYSPLAQEYILDNFTRFSTMEETIVEIIPALYFNKTKGEYSLHLRDYYDEGNESLLGKTLVLVDGLLVQNLDPLFSFDPHKIEKISIIPRGYIYGSKIFDGIVSFITKEQDFSISTTGEFIMNTSLLRPLGNKDYFNPEHEQSENHERIPDYRNQLLWLPKISFSGKTQNISFFTSDIPGEYEIKLEGFSHSGKPVLLQQTFTVE